MHCGREEPENFLNPSPAGKRHTASIIAAPTTRQTGCLRISVGQQLLCLCVVKRIAAVF